MTVLSLDEGPQARPVTAQLLPVHRLRRGDRLCDAQAQALRILKDEQETVVLACHAEIISEVDLLTAGGYAGYGKMLVFSAQYPQGLCLA